VSILRLVWTARAGGGLSLTVVPIPVFEISSHLLFTSSVWCMGRKGGGRAAFMKKAQRPTDDDDDGASDGSGEAGARAEMVAKGVATDARDAQPAPSPARGAGDGDGSEGSDGTGSPKGETKGQMTQRHKREAKAVKDQVKRLGKAKKAEGQKLLAEMESRHASELQALEGSSGERDVLKEMEDLSFYSNAEAKKSKGQKRREKLEQEEREREQRIAEELEAMGDTAKDLEEAALLAKLSALRLKMKDIPSDGHCLYRAIEDQIKDLPDGGREVIERAGQPLTYGSLRKLCAEHLLKNQEEFIHFVEVEDMEGFKSYCEEVGNTAAWGGHVELQALSSALSLHVKVHSADHPCVDVGPEHGDTVNVCYLRHSCALGEHYNSCCMAE
jgi:OTU domain-containing protein 6